MRYYGAGDRIYIFGFSRGAFTARFLARMVANVGLLSMGNEEMVPFAYKVYQDYEMGLKDAEPYMITFRRAFCRHERGKDTDTAAPGQGVKVHFLGEFLPAHFHLHLKLTACPGLFDTVSSVGTFDIPFGTTITLPDVKATAEHVRHAVAVDERRVKFKPALLAQDRKNILAEDEDIKEVWFPGNHGDIGGGWLAENEQPAKDLKWSKWLKRIFNPSNDDKASLDPKNDYFQLSDIALKWMMDELDHLPKDKPQWDEKEKDSFLRRFARSRHYAIGARMHDTMSFGGGSSFGKVLLWKFMGASTSHV